MKKLSLYLLIICAIWTGLADPSAIAGPLANNNKPGTYARSIEQILKYNSNDIDIGTAAMIISEQWSDNVLGRQYIFELDKMAHHILKELKERGRGTDYKAIEAVLKSNGWRFERKVRSKAPAIKDRQNAVRAKIKSAAGDVRLFVNPQTAPWSHKGLATVQLKEGSSFQEDDRNQYQHITTAIGYMIDYEWPVSNIDFTTQVLRL